MYIYADGYGGDNYRAVITGYLAAAKELVGRAEIILVGPTDEIDSLMTGQIHHNVKTLHCGKQLSMDMEINLANWRDCKNTSMMVAAKEAAREAAREAAKHRVGFVSCGNTAAIYAIGNSVAKRIHGIERPGLATILPNLTGGSTVLMDAGGMVDCKPEYLDQFATMASIYCKVVEEMPTPRVGLLNIGTESTKGDDLTKAAYALLAVNKSINFIGNVEASQNFSGIADIIITDGFAGNVDLKSAEGTAKTFSILVRQYLDEHPLAKIPAFFLKPMFRAVAGKLDPRHQGGAVILGSDMPIVKGHGSSDALAAKNALLFLYRIMSSKLIEEQITRFAQ